MTFLFFDTETTGLPDYRMPCEWEGQPRICQVGAILTDAEGTTKAELNLIVRPDGFTIPPQAATIHGITQEVAVQYGVAIKGILGLMHRLIGKATLVVAHNLQFDRFMIEREAAAAGMPPEDFACSGFCTMESARDFCRLPPTPRMLEKGVPGFKSPSLQEAHRHFFGREFDGAHDAMADVRACRDVFFNLKRLTNTGETQATREGQAA